jgi:hypothetical protein
MASHGREESCDRKRAEIKKKIAEQMEVAKELQKDVGDKSQQFKELLTKARGLRKVFDELDNEHAERERTGVPGHVRDNVEWGEARTNLHQIYHVVRTYIEQNAPKDEGLKLAPFEPRKLKTQEPSTKQRGKEGENSKKKKTEEEQSQRSSTSAKSVYPVNPLQLKQFLEGKNLDFHKKPMGLRKETNKTRKEALAQVVIQWLNRVGELEKAVEDVREQMTDETELGSLDEAWKDLSATITKAKKKVKDFVEPPSFEEEDARESVASWVKKHAAGGEDKRKQQYSDRGSRRGSPEKKGSSSCEQR